jgi:hypothetical protein
MFYINPTCWCGSIVIRTLIIVINLMLSSDGVPLKVDTEVTKNEVGQKDGYGWVLVWAVAIDGFLPFEHAVFVSKNIFPFLLLDKLKGDVSNRQSGTKCSSQL